MEVFEIEGKRRLKGEIPVSGLKNAATPILAAALLSRETCVLENVPRIEDVFRMLEIIESLGATVEWRSAHTVAVTAREIHPAAANQEAVKRLRSSILLLGALAGRCDNFFLRQPGGCVIGARPVGTHIDALEKMGISIRNEQKGYRVNAARRHAATVTLREFSVTATENVMLLAATLPQTTVIKIAATEPHVLDLGRFLAKMGARVKGLGTNIITITGGKKLRGVRHAIFPDHNEAATFLILGVATKSPITVTRLRPDHLDLVLEKLREFGADFKVGKNSITVIPPKKLRAVPKIDTRFYPGIPTDIQAPLGVLATQAAGTTLIFDTLFEGRFNYLTELEKMGGQSQVLNPHQALITGPTPLRGTVIKSFDLRSGAALIIAALVARGITTIEDIYQVDRGYERIEERLQRIGARIRRREQTLAL